MPVESIKHKDARTNITTQELRGFVAVEEEQPPKGLYPRDPSFDAMKKLEACPGCASSSRAAVCRSAITRSSRPQSSTIACRRSSNRRHSHWRLTSLLKDADGLDRVRLGDLDPRYLRNPQARGMMAFAEALFDQTDRAITIGPAHFAALWPQALRILDEMNASA